MKAILKGLGLLSVLIFLAACKNDEALQADNEEKLTSIQPMKHQSMRTRQ